MKGAELVQFRPVTPGFFLVRDDHLTIAGSPRAALVYAALEYRAYIEGEGVATDLVITVGEIQEIQRVLQQNRQTIAAGLRELMARGVIAARHGRGFRWHIRLNPVEIRARMGDSSCPNLDTSAGSVVQKWTASYPKVDKSCPKVDSSYKEDRTNRTKKEPQPEPAWDGPAAAVHTLLEESKIRLQEDVDAPSGRAWTPQTVRNIAAALAIEPGVGLPWFRQYLHQILRSGHRPPGWGVVVWRCQQEMRAWQQAQRQQQRQMAAVEVTSTSSTEVEVPLEELIARVRKEVYGEEAAGPPAPPRKPAGREHLTHAASLVRKPG